MESHSVLTDMLRDTSRFEYRDLSILTCIPQRRTPLRNPNTKLLERKR